MLYIMNYINSVTPFNNYLSKFLSMFQWITTRIELPSREPSAEYLYKFGPNTRWLPEFNWQSFIDWIYSMRFGLQDVIFIMIILYLGILFYRKIRYPFWNIQPVLHDYDIFSRWIWNTHPHIICKSPVKLKYYNRVPSTQTIETLITNAMSRETAEQICQFLRENWIPSDRILSTMIEKNLFPLFLGHEYKSFYSIIQSKGVADSKEPRLEGVIISHPMVLYLKIGNTIQKIDTMHIDYMAVRRDQVNNPDTMHVLFQTHEYNHRMSEPKIATTLFKKEVDPCDSLVVFIEYKCSLYYLRLYMKLPRLPAHFQIIEITHKTNTDMLHTLFERKYLTNTFQLVMVDSIPNIIALLKNRQLRIFSLKRKEDVFAFYFFRDPYLFYEDLNGKQIDLVASFMNTEDIELAYHGFLYSIKELLREKKLDDLYNVLQIHGLGHNKLLEEKWIQHHTKIMETKINYYLYNHTYSEIDSSQVFFL